MFLFFRLHQHNPQSVLVLLATPTQEQKKLVEESKLKHFKAKIYLFQSIERKIIETILNKSSPKAIWDSMAKKYHEFTKVKSVQLQVLKLLFLVLQLA